MDYRAAAATRRAASPRKRNTEDKEAEGMRGHVPATTPTAPCDPTPSSATAAPAQNAKRKLSQLEETSTANVDEDESSLPLKVARRKNKFSTFKPQNRGPVAPAALGSLSDLSSSAGLAALNAPFSMSSLSTSSASLEDDSSSAASVAATSLRRSLSMGSIAPLRLDASAASSSSGVVGRAAMSRASSTGDRFLASPSTSTHGINSPGSFKAAGSSSPSLQQQSGSALQGLTRLPLDWSVKTRLRIRSAEPFTWCQLAEQSALSTAWTGLAPEVDSFAAARVIAMAADRAHSVTSNTSTFPGADSSSPSEESGSVDVASAAMLWRHPVETLPLAFLTECRAASAKAESNQTLTPTQAGNAKFLQDRRERWRGAMLSALEAVLCYQPRVRRGAPFVYVVPSMTAVDAAQASGGSVGTGSSLSSVVILLIAAGVAGYTRPTAIVSHSTTGLQQKLKRARVHFRVPFAKAAGQSGNNDDDSLRRESEEAELRQELEMLRKNGIKTAPTLRNLTKFDKSAASLHQTDSKGILGVRANKASMLLFEGESAIRSLAGELIGELVVQADQLPTIISSTPFAHASLDRCQVSSKTVRQAATFGKGIVQVHELALEGFLVPTMVDAVVESVLRHHTTTWEMSLETLGCSTSLNVPANDLGPLSPRAQQSASRLFSSDHLTSLSALLGTPTSVPGKVIRTLQCSTDKLLSVEAIETS